jgi:hypothetical protein
MGTRPYTIDPQVAHERATKAARASHSLDSYIKRIVARAPELTPEQRDRLATLLRPTGHAPDESGGGLT